MTKAFNILIEEHQAMLTNYVIALRYGDRRDAEDIVQEAFLTAYRQLAKFRQGENFARWLRGIARNKVLEHCRGQSNKHVVTDSRILEGMEEIYGSLDTQPGEETWLERNRRWLNHCIGKLSDPFKAAVDCVYRQNLSLQQAAEKEQISFAAMAQRLSRSREQLRQCVRMQMEQES